MLGHKKLIAAAVAGALAAGCANQGGVSNQAIGGFGGAATGAAIGALAGGDWKGALIGAAAGALVGWGAAKLLEYNSTQVRSASADQQIYGVTDRVNSPLVKIRKGSNAPSQIVAGDRVKISTDYSVQLPAGMSEAAVQESWTLMKDGKRLTEIPPQNTRRTAGGYVADASIAIPQDAKPGTYVIQHKVQTGTSYDTDESVFVIGG